MNFTVAILFLLIQDGEVERLIRELDHEDIERRDRASETLRRLTPESVDIDRRLDTVARAGTSELSKRADRVRQWRIAGRFTPDPVRLVERLTSADLAIKMTTLSALSKRGGQGAPLVRDLLHDPSPDIRMWAARIIIAADDPAYLPDVRPLAENPQLAQTVLPWLAARGDLAAAAPLRAMIDTAGLQWAMDLLARLRQTDDIPRFRAILNDQPQFAPQLLRAIRGWEEAKRQLSAEIRYMAYDGIMEAVLVAADSRDTALAARFKALCAMENLPAVFALGAMGDREAAPFLLRAVRYRRLHSAIAILGRLRVREAVPVFRRLLGEAQVPEARDRAAYARALGEIGGTEAEDLLLFMMEDANEEVRFDAAMSLGRLKCRRALPQLARALDDGVVFPRPVQVAPGAPLLDQYESRPTATEWKQGREAAAIALESISGETREGTLDVRTAAWRAWWASRK